MISVNDFWRYYERTGVCAASCESTTKKTIWTYFFMLKCYSSTSHTGSTSGDGRVKRFAARKGKEYYNHTQCQGGSRWLQGWFLHGILGFVTTIGLTGFRRRQRNDYRYFFCLTTILTIILFSRSLDSCHRSYVRRSLSKIINLLHARINIPRAARMKETGYARRDTVNRWG